jgi:hypothetical protein
MLFYGDRVQVEPTRQAMARLEDLLGAVETSAPGLQRHEALVSAFIAASQVLQGVADAEMMAVDQDDVTPAQRAGMALLLTLARRIASSWRGGGAASQTASAIRLRRWAALRLSDEIRAKAAEGYAHYALYPEAAFEAAARCAWTAPPRVLGLRSIGTGLAAMVAVGTRARLQPLTLRPVGPPFARQLRLSGRLRSEILSSRTPFAVVDEGPGLSGSSFGAVGDFLEAGGVARDGVTFLPSHAGEPGPRADPAHRDRWRQARRVVTAFDTPVLGEAAPARRLDRWVGDLVGPILEPRRDLSGGRWREVRGLDAPATPSLERHKFLYRTASGDCLAKFAGLGEGGATKAQRAALLATAQDGAPMRDLLDMARINGAEALGDAAGAVIVERLERLSRTAPPGRPIAVDGRLHAWEWIETPDGRLLKTDAVDHALGHDLIGCQEIAWDIAGARVELDLSSEETAWLTRAVERMDGGETSPARVALHEALYAAFQLGLWSVGQDGDVENARRIAAHAERYRRTLLAFADRSRLEPLAGAA